MEKDPFKEYLRESEPDKAYKGYAWSTAIGLQAVDGLKPSKYLIDTAIQNIEGKITMKEAQTLIDSYYEERPVHLSDDERTEEADKVSSRIAEILSETAFSFSPNEYISIHRKLFQGIYKHAGKIRDYNITKKEWVLDGATVMYGSASELRATLEYDFSQEKDFSYKGLSMDEIIHHLAVFVSRLWQIHIFGEGNTRTTAVFFIKYLKTLGFSATNDIFAENAWYFRNALVRANYTNLQKGIHETTEYLEAFLRNLLLNEKNELHNRKLHISGLLNEEKVDIGDTKVDIENKLEKIGQNSFTDNYVKTDDILKDMCGIIESSQKAAYQAVNTLLVQRNWLIGYRIAEEELGGDERSEYGLEVIKKISKELTQRYGKGYDRSNLYHCLKFYKTFPEIVDTACRQSGVLLSWSHYRTLLQVKDPEARDWYEKEAAEQTWSVRTLQRNISSQYYYRMLGTQKKELVESEMKELTAPYQNDKLEFIKNPVVAEFLGFSQNTDFTESDLEKSILSNLQKFLMELGKGYAFVARQQHIHTEKQDYYIDLVFYNYILKCFVLIDLKTEKITHQDVGQMDMYIRMYDELKRSEGDNPTIGIVLCSDTDDDIARYSVMHGNEQLFASKYKLYLPTKEELRAEIETQKAMFYLQQQDNEEKETE